MSKWFEIQGAKYFTYVVEVEDNEDQEAAVEAAFSLGESLDEYEVTSLKGSFLRAAKDHADEVFPLEDQ